MERMACAEIQMVPEVGAVIQCTWHHKIWETDPGEL